MHTTFHVTASDLMTAREVARNRAHAEGWGHVIVFGVRQTGPRDYAVDLVVSQLRR